MTPEQLAVLKEMAEEAKSEHVGTGADVRDIAKKFRNLFTPTTCLELLEEVGRLRKEDGSNGR